MDGRLEEFRGDLVGYCYRMLGCPFEAEDAVQETLVRAWRNFDRYDDHRLPLRSWLYAIATNVCLDMLRGAPRRVRAMDLRPASRAGAPLGDPLPAGAWVHPIPDGRMQPANGDPAEPVARSETVRLAFIAALQLLPPRQRAVLILRDVLCWTTAEISGLLNTSVVPVTSALQRARANLRAAGVMPGGLPAVPAEQRLLIDRYRAAFAENDVETLVSLLCEDATMSMPPFAWWLRGREEIRRALLGAGRSRDGRPCDGRPCDGRPATAPGWCRLWPTARPRSGSTGRPGRTVGTGRSRSSSSNCPAT